MVAEELYKYEAFYSKVYLDLLYPVNINGSRMWRGGITEVNGIFSFTSVILSGFFWQELDIYGSNRHSCFYFRNPGLLFSRWGATFTEVIEISSPASVILGLN